METCSESDSRKLKGVFEISFCNDDRLSVFDTESVDDAAELNDGVEGSDV